MDKNPFETLNSIAQIIYDKKGFNILAIDVQGMSSITDFLLIAEGNIDRHVSSIANAIVSGMEEKPIHVEGIKNGDWVVLDYGDITVHIFSPRFRERYSLERLWGDSKIVDLEIDITKKASTN